VKALDLFCGAGGASTGLHNAGFDVYGVDIEQQPEYPFLFTNADALEVLDKMARDPYVERPTLIWASPPCQAFTAYKRRKQHVKPRPNLIPELREKLQILGVPYIIENVHGAPLCANAMLCGSMFGLDVRRHRFFETSFPVLQPPCQHKLQTPRFPCATNRKNLRRTVEVGVWRIPLEVQRRAMGIGWMSLAFLSQAIPPAYSEWLARRFLEHRPS